MRIRPAATADAPEVALLLAELGYPNSEEDATRALSRYLDSTSSVVLVADRDDRSTLLGLISGHLIPLLHAPGNLGRITSLIVGGQHRSSGIGSELLGSLEAWFREHDCLRIEVTSGEQRDAAHKFYRSRGYEPSAQRFIKWTDAQQNVAADI